MGHELTLSLIYLRVGTVLLLPLTFIFNVLVQHALIYYPGTLEGYDWSDKSLALFTFGFSVLVVSIEIGIFHQVFGEQSYILLYKLLRTSSVNNQGTFKLSYVLAIHWILTVFISVLVRWSNQFRFQTGLTIESSHLISNTVFFVMIKIFFIFFVLQALTVADIPLNTSLSEFTHILWVIFPLLCICSNRGCRTYAVRFVSTSAVFEQFSTISRSITTSVRSICPRRQRSGSPTN